MARKRDVPAYPDTPEPPKGTKSPPKAMGSLADADNPPVQPPGTDKNYDNPADARPEDVEKALASVPDEKDPAPFRKRDGFPDITSESVQVRMLADYWPKDTSRFGNQMRARKGEFVAFPSDEALDLISEGIAERVDDEKAGVPDEKGRL